MIATPICPLGRLFIQRAAIPALFELSFENWLAKREIANDYFFLAEQGLIVRLYFNVSRWSILGYKIVRVPES